MTLLQFISSLITQNVNVIVIDGETEQTIIEFKSQGYAGVEGDVSARTVKKWAIAPTNIATAITVTLDAAEQG